MNRLTRAAVATTSAALLLLGGAGTLAYWTGTGTATGTALNSGSLTVTDGTCDAWTFTAADGGGTPTDIIPGDSVQTVCTVTVQGVGDHLGVTAALDTAGTAFAETNDLASAITLDTGDVLLDGAAVPTAGFDISDGAAHTVTVTVTAEFPYGDATSVSPNSTQNLVATLDDVVIDVVQTHLTPGP